MTSRSARISAAADALERLAAAGKVNLTLDGNSTYLCQLL